MGIFTRFRDIINANINAILDTAEDPEKMIRLMISEMEDTLVEIKSSCAGVMANRKKVEREARVAQSRAIDWGEKADLAVRNSRDDLAREALIERRRYTRRITSVEEELKEFDVLVEKYKSDIRQLEDKLRTAREKQRILIQRHIHARKKKRLEEEIRWIDSSEAIIRFDGFENNIERMEADADLVNYGKQNVLEEELNNLLVDDEIEKELQSLKSSRLD
jgi:phage shock protein A